MVSIIIGIVLATGAVVQRSAFDGSVCRRSAPPSMSAERPVVLSKPLGIVLEECDGRRGVRVQSLIDEGSASEAGGEVAPGDYVHAVNGVDVRDSDFDTVMQLLIEGPNEVSLVVDDGIGKLDTSPNLAKSLALEDAVLADEVVRAAVREVRLSQSARDALGELLRVEIVLGAGVRDDGRCLVRFFGIFSTDGWTASSTYSCNISATGRRREGGIQILALSCAKDEGWGRTIDLKREEK